MIAVTTPPIGGFAPPLIGEAEIDMMDLQAAIGLHQLAGLPARLALAEAVAQAVRRAILGTDR